MSTRAFQLQYRVNDVTTELKHTKQSLAKELRSMRNYIKVRISKLSLGFTLRLDKVHQESSDLHIVLYFNHIDKNIYNLNDDPNYNLVTRQLRKDEFIKCLPALNNVIDAFESYYSLKTESSRLDTLSTTYTLIEK